jgi:hypothetical protein
MWRSFRAPTMTRRTARANSRSRSTDLISPEACVGSDSMAITTSPGGAPRSPPRAGVLLTAVLMDRGATAPSGNRQVPVAAPSRSRSALRHRPGRAGSSRGWPWPSMYRRSRRAVHGRTTERSSFGSRGGRAGPSRRPGRASGVLDDRGCGRSPLPWCSGPASRPVVPDRLLRAVTDPGRAGSVLVHIPSLVRAACPHPAPQHSAFRKSRASRRRRQ